MPILATAVTTIECDGHHGAVCPDNASVEFPFPQSVAIRLARQSGWTVWIETMCPECVKVGASASAPAPKTPEVLTVDAAAPALVVLEAEEVMNGTVWCARMKSERRRMPVSV